MPGWKYCLGVEPLGNHLARAGSTLALPDVGLFWSENMNAMKTVAFAATLAFASTAGATSFVVTTDSVVGAVAATSDASSDASSSFTDDKVVMAARDDAAAFVASQGSIRGVRLEAALQHIRQQIPSLRNDDMQLAAAILSL